MSGITIRAEGLSKQYRLGGAQQRYKTLRDSIANAAMRPFRRHGSCGAPADDSLFWALKDVSFEIKAGEVVGVIGRNGAGKSTLLKVLSRITEPTAGYAEIHGRVGSLLEVGTGFHPELTGRENIYLNGAILGMRRAEVDRKLDEIISFAEIERFVDTPVKFYSSGMYLRLAFAVAAHLEPDILLVDEVLAVGDASFQNKSLGKMKTVARSGRTVLFVSHNMGAIATLCDSVIALESGSISERGAPADVIRAHLRRTRSAVTTDLLSRKQRRGRHNLKLSGIKIINAAEDEVTHAVTGESLTFELQFQQFQWTPSRSADFELKFRNSSGILVLTLSTYLQDKTFSVLGNSNRIYCFLPMLPLVPDVYDIEANCMAGRELEDQVLDAAQLTVVDGRFYSCGVQIRREWHGICVATHEWRTGRPLLNR